MIESISDYIANYFITRGTAKEEDRDVYMYGLAVLLYNIFLVFFIVILSFFLHNVTETLFFIATLIVMRKYTGGHHADTRLKCFFTTVTVYSITVIVSKLNCNGYMPIIIYSGLGISYILMLLFAPISGEQIEWSEKRMKVIKKCNRICLLAYLFIILIMNYLNFKTLAIYISLAIVSTAISLVIEILKLKEGRRV